MRIHVIGDSAGAKTLRAYLQSQGFTLSATAAAYTLRMEEGPQANVLLEGVRGKLADEAQHAIAELLGPTGGGAIEWRRAKSGSDRELRVVASAETADSVERGLLRAILRLTVKSDVKTGGWIAKILRRK